MCPIAYIPLEEKESCMYYVSEEKEGARYGGKSLQVEHSKFLKYIIAIDSKSLLKNLGLLVLLVKRW